MGFWSTLGQIAGIAAAPFTGGASLALTAISIGASTVDALQKRSAANNVEEALVEGGQEALAYNTPFYGAGLEALPTLSELANVSHQDIHKMAFIDPGFQFRLEEGTRAVERSSAARGNLLSGGTLKDLTKYAQSAASQEYANAYQRAATGVNDQYRRAAGIVASGQRAGETMGGLRTDIASAEGAGDVGRANIWGDLIGNAANAVGGYLGSRNASTSTSARESSIAPRPVLESRPLNLGNTAVPSGPSSMGSLAPRRIEPTEFVTI